MSAIELFHQDGHSAGVFYCSNCRSVRDTQAMAEGCCGDRLCACGKPTKSRYAEQCRECDSKAWRERMAREEMERYEKAVKINAADYDGDQVFWGDKYFDSVDDAVEHAESGGMPIPEYVWATKDQGVRKARIEDLLDQVIESMWEDADYDDLNGIPELEKAISEFNEANSGVVVWMVDFSTAILIPGGYLRSLE